MHSRAHIPVVAAATAALVGAGVEEAAASLEVTVEAATSSEVTVEAATSWEEVGTYVVAAVAPCGEAAACIQVVAAHTGAREKTRTTEPRPLCYRRWSISGQRRQARSPVQIAVLITLQTHANLQYILFHVSDLQYPGYGGALDLRVVDFESVQTRRQWHRAGHASIEAVPPCHSMADLIPLRPSIKSMPSSCGQKHCRNCACTFIKVYIAAQMHRYHAFVNGLEMPQYAPCRRIAWHPASPQVGAAGQGVAERTVAGSERL